MSADQSIHNSEEEPLLVKSENVYYLLFEKSLNGIAYCKMLYDDNEIPQDFIYIETNPAFETLTGLKNVMGKKVSEVIPNIRESDPELFEAYSKAALTGKSAVFETYVNALNMWFSISVYSPQRQYFVAVFDVITERKLAEQRLKENEKKYHSMFQNLVDLFYRADMNGIITEVSPSVFALTGWKSEEVLGHNVLDLYPNPDERKMLLEKIMKDGMIYGYEVTLLHKDGRHVPVSVSSNLIKDEQGNPQYIEGVIRDITDQKKREDALKKGLEEISTLKKEVEDLKKELKKK
jgi:PAS domain S-box-containing protein